MATGYNREKEQRIAAGKQQRIYECMNINEAWAVTAKVSRCSHMISSLISSLAAPFSGNDRSNASATVGAIPRVTIAACLEQSNETEYATEEDTRLNTREQERL